MNLLSFCSLATCFLYVCMAARWQRVRRRDLLSRIAVGVLLSLSWWALCDAFFYVAPTLERAWLWHHLSALGWCGFIPLTARYFFAMTDTGDAPSLLRSPLQKLIYWTPGGLFTLKMMLPGQTALTQDLVQSSSGLGWTYVHRFDSPWPYLYWLMLFAYLIASLIYLLFWQRKAKIVGTQALAQGFVALDLAAVAVGVVTIYLVPYFTDFLPPMSFLATLLFLAGYWRELREHDLLHFELSLEPESILENSLDALLITDRSFHILYSNREAKRLLMNSAPEGLLLTDQLTPEGAAVIRGAVEAPLPQMSGIELTLLSGLSLLCSITGSKTHKHALYIFSLHDVTPLKDAQQKLQRMAHYDELTGLANRRRLGHLLDEWDERFSREGDFALFFLDVDNFKGINDRYGHNAGDMALKASADAISGSIGPKDVAVRLGGDEFIVLHDLADGECEEISHRLSQAVEGIDCRHFAPGCHISLSIGWSRYSEAGSVRAMYKLADERMYADKSRKD